MSNEILFEEKVISHKTEGLFIFLTLLFIILSIILFIGKNNLFSLVSFLLFLFFLFYSLNYRTLAIQITSHLICLRFGIFKRTIRWEEFEEIYFDDISMWRIGGAGIHFRMIRRRYRVMFNFLEHKRIAILLRKGLVREVVFSTQHPEEIMKICKEKLS